MPRSTHAPESAPPSAAAAPAAAAATAPSERTAAAATAGPPRGDAGGTPDEGIAAGGTVAALGGDLPWGWSLSRDGSSPRASHAASGQGLPADWVEPGAEAAATASPRSSGIAGASNSTGTLGSLSQSAGAATNALGIPNITGTQTQTQAQTQAAIGLGLPRSLAVGGRSPRMSSDGFRSLQRVRERAAAAASNSSLSSGQPPLPAASLASGSPDAAEARLEALSRLQTSHLKASTDRLLEWARSTAEDLAFASTSSPATMPATLPATIPASLPAQAGGAGIVSSPYALGADLAALGLFGDARRPSRDEFREADIADAEDLPVWPVSAGTTAPGSLGRPRAKTTTVATTAVLASQDARSLRSSSPTRSVTLSDVSEDGTAASADLFDDAARSHSPLNNSKLYISISDSDAARSHVLPPPPATSVHAASAVPRLLSALGSGESQTADKQLVAASSATSLRLDSQSSLTLPSVTEMEANLPLLISRALEQHRAILSTAMKVYDVSIQFTEINQALLGEAAHVKTLQDACDEQVQQLAQMRFEYRFRRQELDQLGATSTMVNVLADLSMLFQGCTSMEREFADTREEYETMLQRLEKEGILDPASDSASPVAQAGGSFLPDMDSSSAMMLVGNNASQQGLLQRQWSESETDFVLRRKYDKMLHTVRLNDDRLRRLHETIEQQLPRNRLMMSVLPLLRGFGSRYSSWIQDARLMALEIKQELDKILLIRERTPAQRRVKRRATWTDGGPRANVTELLSRRSSWRNDVAADSPVSPVRAISPSRLAEPHSPAELKSQPRTESAETRTEAGDFVPLDLAFDGLFDKTPIVAQSKQRSGLLGFVQRAVLTALDLVRAVVESL